MKAWIFDVSFGIPVAQSGAVDGLLLVGFCLSGCFSKAGYVGVKQARRHYGSRPAETTG